MRVQFSQTKVAGGITIGIGGFIATMTAESAAEWLALVTQFAPIALCGWLLYVLYRLEHQHNDCRDALLEVHKELNELHAEVAVLKTQHLRDSDDGR